MAKIVFSLTNESDSEIADKPLQKLSELILREETPHLDAEIYLLLCEDETMRRYNRQYRGDDTVTDVLCFLQSPELPIALVEGVPALCCDIIIDINQLNRQKGSNTLTRELRTVLIHGLLHACGYDHIRHSDREAMEEREQHYIHLMEGTD